jgi:hypothetical protein
MNGTNKIAAASAMLPVPAVLFRQSDARKPSVPSLPRARETSAHYLSLPALVAGIYRRETPSDAPPFIFEILDFSGITYTLLEEPDSGEIQREAVCLCVA